MRNPAGPCTPVAPGARVRIYELAREFNIIYHLCVDCLAVLLTQAKPWQQRMNRTPPFGDFCCDRCEKGIV